MNNTFKNVVAGAVLAGAGFVGGAAGGIEASEVTKIDATQARSVGEVLIEKVITAPQTTVERYTLNDLVSEVQMIDAQIASLQSRRANIVAKVQAVQAEAQTKFEAEEAKRAEEAEAKESKVEAVIE